MAELDDAGRPLKNGWRYKKPRKYAHRLVVEKAMGKPLPDGAVVHHIDGNGWNNSSTNLIVCPNQAYHILLHRRQEAFNATGNANLVMCDVCHQYDDPDNLTFVSTRPGRQRYHKHCNALRQRRYNAARR